MREREREKRRRKIHLHSLSSLFFLASFFPTFPFAFLIKKSPSRKRLSSASTAALLPEVRNSPSSVSALAQGKGRWIKRDGEERMKKDRGRRERKAQQRTCVIRWWEAIPRRIEILNAAAQHSGHLTIAVGEKR